MNQFPILLVSFVCGEYNNVFFLFLDDLFGLVDHNHIFQVPIQIFQVLNITPMWKDHAFMTEIAMDNLLSRVEAWNQGL